MSESSSKFCYTCVYHLDGGTNACDSCTDDYNNWVPRDDVIAACRYMVRHGGCNLESPDKRESNPAIPQADGDEGETWYDSMSGRRPREQNPIQVARDRPSFRTIYMRMAHELASRSTCSRLQVGTVITTPDFRKVLSIGYNGNASGLPNRCDRDEAGNCGCLHSEENAVINCDAPRSAEKIIFATHLPCVMCAKRLINMGGVRIVYYDKSYRIEDAKDLLLASAIQVVQYPDLPRPVKDWP